MTPGLYNVGPASCRVSMTSLKPPPTYAHCLRELTHLYVEPEHRQQMHATKLLAHLCELADREAIVLMLVATPGDGDIPIETLEAFYRRCGFRALQRAPLVMSRPPNLETTCPKT
jgi:GNAT superfamily N-acetyltransferase